MSGLPKVSAVMPVGKGDTYYPLALACFSSQDYEGELELIVVDNSDVPISVPDDPRIKYFRVERMPVGALRNYGNSQATGEVIVNWDEDDWSASNRISFQVERLTNTGKALTGFHNICFFDLSTGSTYKYYFEPNIGRNHIPYCCGTSQCYTRSFWRAHPYPTTGVEDYLFQLAALHLGQIDSVDADQLCVARAHTDSMCPPQFGHRQFPAVPKDTLPNQFFAAIKPKKIRSK